MFKRSFTALLLAVLFTTAAPSAGAVSLQIDNAAVIQDVFLYNATTYAPLRAVSQQLCPGANVAWTNGQAIVQGAGVTLTARPGDCYLEANGRAIYIPDKVLLRGGTLYVPVRAVAEVFGATAEWDARTQRALLTSGGSVLISGDQYYNSDDLYWLSRIIEAESGGEPLKGKIAVGNVILNRVASPSCPNTIYDVIFDTKWGVQFQPVANGAIYNTPSEESVLAAKLCLDGASVAGNSLYFLNPAIATNFWIVEACTYVTTIGNHQFYA